MPHVAHLLLPAMLLAACTPADTGHTGGDSQHDSSADSSSDSSSDSQPDSGDSGSPPVDPFPGLDYTNSTTLDLILDWDNAPTGPHWQVRLCRSTEWWGRGCDTYFAIAHGLSSLDLMVTEEGLIIMAVPDFPWLGQMDLDGVEEILWNHFYALTTPDLEHWGTQIWSVEHTDSGRFIDPALSLHEDGTPRVIYYSWPEDAGEEDPALYPGEHMIKRADWDGEGFVEQVEPIYAAETLADPVLCDLGGQAHMFITDSGAISHVTSDDGAVSFTKDEDFVWGGAQVPHCTTQEEPMVIVAQGGGGVSAPVTRTMDEDFVFGEPTQLWNDEENLGFFGGSCTSPVFGIFMGEYITLCASYMEMEEG